MPGMMKKATPTPKPKPSATKKSAPTSKPKKKTLDDFLTKGKRPPIKLKPGLERPRGL
jgi:hypothetical protein